MVFTRKGLPRIWRHVPVVRTKIRMTALRNDDYGDKHSVENKQLYLGIDFGTSGARYVLVDSHGTFHSEKKRSYPQTVVRFYI